MADALALLFDAEADAAVRALWQRLDRAGVPSLAGRTHRRHRPHVTLALAGTIPAKARATLRTELSLIAVPRLWLSALSTFADGQHVLMLSAVVDTELLAVHSAVHDVLAGRVRNASAYYLPGSWVPHCTLAQDLTPPQVVAGFAALYPVGPIQVTVSDVGVIDTTTGDVDRLTG